MEILIIQAEPTNNSNISPHCFWPFTANEFEYEKYEYRHKDFVTLRLFETNILITCLITPDAICASTWAQTINFMTRVWLGLELEHVELESLKKFESGPQLAEVCYNPTVFKFLTLDLKT